MKGTKMEQPTKEDFLESIKSHKLQIVRDEGVHRHIIMSDGSSNMRYEVITCPWFLLYCGDMGCYTFHSIEDNFDLFRPQNNDLVIKSRSWHKKLEAVDRDSGSLVYSPDLFRTAVKAHFNTYFEDVECYRKADLWARIEREVLCHAEENEASAYLAVKNFKSLGTKPGIGLEPPVFFEFEDFGETNLKQYTYRYIWCLYAIVYVIMLYDKSVRRPGS